jgi:hypothetical protein
MISQTNKPMHNKTKHKIILKLAESNARHKKTRKMKGGLFGSLFKPKTPVGGPIVPSQQVQQLTNAASTAIQTSAGVTFITTLSGMIETALGRPEVMAAVTGIAGTSVAVATGGLIVVGAAILISAVFIVREKLKAYNGLMLVMDELFLVLQKLSGIADVSMHIADTYGFPIDTRDVNIALNTILTKFDELLDPTDYTSIKNDLNDFRALKNKANGAVNMIIDDAAIRATEQDNTATEPPLSLWTKFNNKRKQIFFSAPKFVEELNEAVAYLALYVGAFSASFSTTYTTVVVQLLINDKMSELSDLQNKVLTDIKFHSMLEGALVYPLLQSQKTYKTCLNRNSTSSCDPTFVAAANNVLSYMQKKFDQSNGVSSALYTKMPNLKKVVDAQATAMSTASDATIFANNVKAAFDADRGAISPALLKPPAAAPAGPQSAVITAIKQSAGDIEMSEIAPNAGVPIAAPATNSQPAATNPPAAATNPPASATNPPASATSSAANTGKTAAPVVAPSDSDPLLSTA